MLQRTKVWKSLPVLLTIVSIVSLVGCGSVQHKVSFQNNYMPKAQAKIEVGQVLNQTQEAFDVNVEQMLSEALSAALSKETLVWESDASTKIVLNTKIIEYSKGNAFKRWLMPGWGSTILTIECDLQEGDKIVGSLNARRTVSIGGAYTVNAWQTIFDSVAKDVVKELKAQIPE